MPVSLSTGLVKKNPWLHIPQPIPAAKLRLFCFSYAGGSAQIFHDWPKHLGAQIEVNAVQLPGRGSRLAEPACTDMAHLVAELYAALSDLFIEPYAFFGHSMGAQVAFELSRHIRQQSLKMPYYLLVSARRAPQLEHKRRQLHLLPRAEFEQELRRLKGTPVEVLQQPELMELVTPALRADFQLIETWQYQPQAPLDLPVAAFGGVADENISFSQLDAWSAQTSGAFSVQMYAGDHFFLHQQQAELLTRIKYLLAPERFVTVEQVKP